MTTAPRTPQGSPSPGPVLRRSVAWSARVLPGPPSLRRSRPRRPRRRPSTAAAARGRPLPTSATSARTRWPGTRLLLADDSSRCRPTSLHGRVPAAWRSSSSRPGRGPHGAAVDARWLGIAGHRHDRGVPDGAGRGHPCAAALSSADSVEPTEGPRSLEGRARARRAMTTPAAMSGARCHGRWRLASAPDGELPDQPPGRPALAFASSRRESDLRGFRDGSTWRWWASFMVAIGIRREPGRDLHAARLAVFRLLALVETSPPRPS